MAHTKAMGIGAMLVLLFVSIAILPMIVRYVSNMEPHFVSGFQDMVVKDVPSQASSSKMWRKPDADTDYLCRSPDDNGKPCKEGTFCDGTTQGCIDTYVGGPVPSVGYFS